MPQPMLFFMLSVFLGISSCLVLAWVFVLPMLRRYDWQRTLPALLLFHAFRYVGLTFLLTGVAGRELSPTFARPAAYGDLVSACLALIAVVAVTQRWRGARPLVWVFNIIGSADLLYAFIQGPLTIPPSRIGAELAATWFIPTVYVPALLVCHGLIFWLLIAQPTDGPPTRT